eukprot:2145864-Alexandrium_andersonii.AAC.1
MLCSAERVARRPSALLELRLGLRQQRVPLDLLPHLGLRTADPDQLLLGQARVVPLRARPVHLGAPSLSALALRPLPVVGAAHGVERQVQRVPLAREPLDRHGVQRALLPL